MAKQTIGGFLGTLRRAHGFTQQEVADKLGISNRTLSAWERDSAMPDILLLPALADLYGVTVDEILRGERRATEAPVISKKSEKALLKNRITKFTMQAWVLTGILCAGIFLYGIGVFFITMGRDRRWLIPMLVGLVAMIVCATVLIALWKGAEMGMDEENEAYPAFVILLRGKVRVSSYIAAGFTFALGLVTLLEIDYWLLLFFGFLPFAAAFYLFGFLFYRRALKTWGEASRIKKDDRLIKRLALFGLIPFGVAVALVAVFNAAWIPTGKPFAHIQSADRDGFVKAMETLVIEDGSYGLPDGEYYLSISAHAESAKAGEEIDLNNGFSLRFNADKSFCSIKVNGTGHWFTAERITAKNGFSVYNAEINNHAYYSYQELVEPFPLADQTVPFVELKADENDYALVLRADSHFGTFALFLGGVIVGAELVACFVIYAVKREKFKVKL